MTICGIDSLLYGVEDVALCTRFFENWGLELAGSGRHGADFMLLDGTTLQLRSRHERSLPPPLVPGSSVRETVWGVDSLDSVAAIGAELSRDREVSEGPDGTVHAFDESGYAIAFRKSLRQAQREPLPQTNSPGCVQRTDARAAGAFPYRIRPRRFVHVVYWIPTELERARRFYTERLGFRVTESVTGAGHFMRCAPSGDHHNLFLQQVGRNAGFQHVAFEVRDIDEVMMCGQHMEQQGWKTHLGPGRHVVGSNVYWYFWCPAGGMVEIGCDLDHITDHWQPLEHSTIPGGGSSWYVRPEDAGLRPGHGEWPQLEETEPLLRASAR
jgi:catechol 2,3-dioxygenase-like lactoylglutathione lyase family enzyme